MYYQRNITPHVLAALEDSPVVLLHGARQAGKSTIAKRIADEAHPARYITLDRAAVLAAASRDPEGFVAELAGPVVIDEVQRVPELALAIKAEVDRYRRPGRFLLTGSANILLLPRLAESLAGRMQILTLWPFSQGEIEGIREQFVDRVFDPARLPGAEAVVKRDELVRRILAGGYPEVVTRAPARRSPWFESYITTILSRDVRDISQRIERLHQLPRLLTVLAARTGTLLNVLDISRTLGIPHTTLTRYLTLLQITFLVHLLPAWAANVRRRLAKSPKIALVDTGLAAHLIGLDARGLTDNPELWGSLLETFVITELLKQATWSEVQPRFSHFRTVKGEYEVDVVLESRAGRVVGIEIKATASVDAHDFRGLHELARASGRKFVRGIVLYLGEESVPFGSGMTALPVSSVWRMGVQPSTRELRRKAVRRSPGGASTQRRGSRS